VRCQEQEERLGRTGGDPGLDPADALGDPGGGEILVAEAGRRAAGEEADPADALVNGAVVAVRPVHHQPVAVVDAVDVVGRGPAVAHPERIGGVEPAHVPVLDEHRRDAVVGGGQHEAVVEAVLERAWREPAVPVGPDAGRPQAEVPLADDRRRVARPPEQGGERGGAGRDDAGRVRRRDPGAAAPEGVDPRQQREPRRRAGRGGTVAAREAVALAGEPVDAGRPHPRGAVARHVPPAEVVGHDEDDVRPLRGRPVGGPAGRRGEAGRHGGQPCDHRPAHAASSGSLTGPVRDAPSASPTRPLRRGLAAPRRPGMIAT